MPKKTVAKYEFVSWQDEGVWTAHSPSVPGVYGIGDTRQKAETDLFEAIGEMFDYLVSIGEKRPKAKRVVSGVLTVAV
jgi:predicted RNase H-like HicB family nuclease